MLFCTFALESFRILSSKTQWERVSDKSRRVTSVTISNTAAVIYVITFMTIIQSCGSSMNVNLFSVHAEKDFKRQTFYFISISDSGMQISIKQ